MPPVAVCRLVVVGEEVTHREMTVSDIVIYLGMLPLAIVGLMLAFVIAQAMWIRHVIGTDFIVWWYRMLGAKIGRRFFIGMKVQF